MTGLLIFWTLRVSSYECPNYDHDSTLFYYFIVALVHNSTQVILLYKLSL